MKPSFRTLGSFAFVFATSCGGTQSPATTAAPTGIETAGPVSSDVTGPAGQIPLTLADVGLDGTALNRDVDPCDDFYEYACGGWIARTEIPSDESRWSRSFDEIRKRNEEDLKSILERARTAPTDDATRAIGAYYGACMDEVAVENAGLAAGRPMLDAIAAMKNVKQLPAVLAMLHKHAIWALFDVTAQEDMGDVTRMIAHFDQNGLGLPDRDYYLETKAPYPEHRKAYQEHVTAMLELVGRAPAVAAKEAKQVLALETQLAKAQKSRVERRDPKAMHNPVAGKALTGLVPKLDMKAYLSVLGLPELADANATSPAYFKALGGIVGKTNPVTMRAYLTWRVIDSLAASLPQAFVDESFRMEQKFTGTPQQRERWKRCVDSVEAALPDLLSQPFIAKRFAGASKPLAEKMVAAIGASFEAGLENLAWMDPATRAQAKEKRRAMEYLIGYPAQWKTHSFAITPDNLLANVIVARQAEQGRQRAKIGQPVDRGEWFMSAHTVNAYYHPLRNHMVFPAGILQPPFYSVDASLAVNMGGMGMVVGHELSHGFDDEGSQFDSQGNLKVWWEAGTRKAFEERAECVERQFEAYEPLPGVKLNGKLTLGENIADLAGVKLAHSALQSMGGDQLPTVQGVPPNQQFFLGFAQAWCSKFREEEVRRRAVTDPHAPPRFRVNGPLSNLPEFSAAFQCAPGSKMQAATPCVVW